MDINELIKKIEVVKPLPGGLWYVSPQPNIECKDGFRVSLRVGEHKYCIPRNHWADTYECVELGRPSTIDPLIEEYAIRDHHTWPDDPDPVVYGFVPINVVEKLIEKHGGIVN